MKILHCCLAAFYIDNAGYQENILPKMHKLDGHEVTIVASTESYIENRKLGYVEAGSYVNEDSIPVTRLPYVSWLPHFVAKKLRLYVGLERVLNDVSPDVIFLHDCQFLDVYKIVSYCRQNPQAKVFVDGHTDFINSAKGWVSKNLLHGILYRHCAKKIEPFVSKFYGVLPVRQRFFTEMYGIPKDKTDLLVLGADDTEIQWNQREAIRNSVREKLGLNEDDIAFICGGKIDRRKNILELLRAMKSIGSSAIKLILFGTPNEDVEEEFKVLVDNPNVLHIGWLKSADVYNYFFAADVAIFPGTHSVLWEQAIGTGLPGIFRFYDGIDHIDLGGNCLFLDSGSVDEIKEAIEKLADDQPKRLEMAKVAFDVGVPTFSYREIARRAIQTS